ncbi:FAD-dependent oxidoreductase [Streptomyces sp. NPDC027717]|uniref:protoporphyrinogen/coproporphyrinogen oxidase n=1 Tax=Streptomyces sp. NPDC027717 TaxID=3155765 RepID=UPI003402E4B3
MLVGIVGGGLCGLAAARRALELGAEVEVFEAEASTGGMASSLRAGELTFDLGPHTLYAGNPAVVHDVRGLLGGRLREVAPERGIWRQGRLYQFPFHLGDFVRTSGLRGSWLPLLRYLIARVTDRLSRHADPASLEEWAVRRFGRPLYEFYVRDHVTKNIGLSPAALPALWGKQRIRIPDLTEAAAQLRGRGAPPRVSYYPERGIGHIPDALTSAVTRRGGRISLSTPVVGWTRTSGGIELNTGAAARTRVEQVDVVVNTGPLDSFLLRARDNSVPPEVTEAARLLSYRSTIFVYLSTDDRQAQMPCDLVYFPEPAQIFSRVYSPAGYSEHCGGPSRTGFCFEIHCDPDDPLWNATDAAIARRTLAEAGTVPFFGLQGRLRVETVARVRKHYPLADPSSDTVRTLDRFLDSSAPQVISAGRLGSHRYVNMDSAMLMGAAAAEAAMGLRTAADIRRIADTPQFVETGRARG